jgi:DNA repair protein RadC
MSRATFQTAYGTGEVRLSYVREDELGFPVEQPIINAADLAAAFFRSTVETRAGFNPEVECFVVLMLDRKNRLKGWQTVSTGTATACLAHPREIFRAAIVASAAAVICLHNHPSGDPAPSAADVQLTRQIREAGKAVDIPVLDHVIRGRTSADPLGRGYYSFREAGLL